MTLQPFYTADQLAARWQISTKTLRRMVRARIIASFCPTGRAVRIPVEAVEAWENRRTKAANPIIKASALSNPTKKTA